MVDSTVRQYCISIIFVLLQFRFSVGESSNNGEWCENNRLCFAAGVVRTQQPRHTVRDEVKIWCVVVPPFLVYSSSILQVQS